MSLLRPSRLAALTAALLLPGLALAASNEKKGDDHIEIQLGGKGAELRTDTSPKELGFAEYPGAVREADKDGESDALSLGLWGESSGFHLALIKYRTSDKPADVARFYAKELARFGPVSTCKGDSDGGKACSSNFNVTGDLELRAGPDKDQRIVAINQRNGHTELVLVRLQTPKD